MITYLIIGIIWAWVLEILTVNYPMDIEKPVQWKYSERLFHWLLWPLSIIVFLYYYIKNS